MLPCGQWHDLRHFLRSRAIRRSVALSCLPRVHVNNQSYKGITMYMGDTVLTSYGTCPLSFVFDGS